MKLKLIRVSLKERILISNKYIVFLKSPINIYLNPQW